MSEKIERSRRRRENDDSPSSSSLWSLPDEIVLECLVRVPRRSYENLSCVSSKLRSLVRSSELYRMRSLLHKDPIYICLYDLDKSSKDCPFDWFTLTEDYELVRVPFPSRHFMFSSASVAVDSEIYFVGGNPRPSELWILNTKSGELRKGPVMREPEYAYRSSVGVADGKMYVVQELISGEIVEEVFDFESEKWDVEGVSVPDDHKNQRLMMPSSVSLEGKVYAMNLGKITTVYNLRQGRRKEKLEMPSGEREAWLMCVANYLLFALFRDNGLMWLDTKCNVWRVVTGDVQTLYGVAMAEYYGNLAVFWTESFRDGDGTKARRIWCDMVSLERVEDGIRGTILWSRVIATVPFLSMTSLNRLS